MEVKTLWQANSEVDERFRFHLEKDNILDQYLLNKKINYGKDILLSRIYRCMYKFIFCCK